MVEGLIHLCPTSKDDNWGPLGWCNECPVNENNLRGKEVWDTFRRNDLLGLNLGVTRVWTTQAYLTPFRSRCGYERVIK